MNAGRQFAMKFKIEVKLVQSKNLEKKFKSFRRPQSCFKSIGLIDYLRHIMKTKFSLGS